MSKLTKKSKIIISFSIALTTVVLLTAISFGLLQFANAGRVIQGLSINGQKIGGLNFEQTKQLLSEKFQQLSQEQITLNLGEKKWQFLPDELGLTFNLDETLKQAMIPGHGSNILTNAKEQISSLFFGKNIAVITDFNAEQFEQVAASFAAVEKPAQDAGLIYNQTKDSFGVSPEIAGAVVNRQELKNRLFANFSNLVNPPIELSLTQEPPKINTQDIKAIEIQARQLIQQAPYYLKSGDSLWPIEKQDLAQWISADPDSGKMTLDKNEIENYLAQIAPTVNQEPINAKLTMQNDKIEILAPSQYGKNLDLEASSQKIAQDILAGQKNIELIIDTVEPEITEKNIENLGLTSLLGQGESNFAGSPKNRKFNMSLGAAKLNGTLIKPGEEFSFNQTLGEVDEKNGYLPELVIKDNKTVPDYGGGICQVSTTLFRAAVISGLKITERHPHAYPVHYYLPTGFDATVYSPTPDLKFLNDTPNYILLQNKIEGNKLIFEIYGTSDGREVKIKGPTITESDPDGSLKTILTQEIWYNGQMESQNIFRSSYKSASLYPVSTSTPSKLSSPAPSTTPSPAPSASTSPLPTN